MKIYIKANTFDSNYAAEVVDKIINSSDKYGGSLLEWCVADFREYANEYRDAVPKFYKELQSLYIKLTPYADELKEVAINYADTDDSSYLYDAYDILNNSFKLADKYALIIDQINEGIDLESTNAPKLYEEMRKGLFQVISDSSYALASNLNQKNEEDCRQIESEAQSMLDELNTHKNDYQWLQSIKPNYYKLKARFDGFANRIRLYR